MWRAVDNRGIEGRELVFALAIAIARRCTVESFFDWQNRELKVEVFAMRDQALLALFEYLEVFDNRVRRHSYLGFVAPVEFERMHNRTH